MANNVDPDQWPRLVYAIKLYRLFPCKMYAYVKHLLHIRKCDIMHTHMTPLGETSSDKTFQTSWAQLFKANDVVS